MMIDVRSDTVTKPTKEMLEAMMQAKVGDDVFGEDETVNALQEKAAQLFGMEAALFCSSGTQTNQIAIKVHTQPGDEVICSELAHIYLYEGGGIAFNSGASVRLLSGDRGRFTAQQVSENINKKTDVHFALTRMVGVENTMNKGGGCCWDLNELKRIKTVCADNGLAFHLDGARLFNALVAKGEQPAQYGNLFDTISICLSKGLGAPVGSLLLGTRSHIEKARRIRKVLGGGMRQAGFLAAAGIYALDHHITRLSEDHQKAKALEQLLASQNYVETVLPAETNVVIFKLGDHIAMETFLNYLQNNGVKAVSMGRQLIRFVMHLDINNELFERLCSVVTSFEG
ncbi:MAG: aminotransferase class V-fold PLP-dependent enzyme [Bacteroidia bacterium]|nr:aminotransferase class V-fold PLP-dependent enzyme [Bacteroidia bacterium]